MSLSPEKIKQVVIKGIEVNPSNIEIRYISKIEKDGAFEEVEIVKKLKVVIYYESTSKSNSNAKSDTIGTSYSNKTFSMMADYTAGLNVNSRNNITFSCIEGKMRIASINPIVVNEVICGYECSLERID
ncbi:MAG: hypothetical protein ACRCX2_14290 [Paraclostridium sp.]